MLNKLARLREEREDGFTLIELLVVVLIIGILAAIAIPVFLNQQKSANDGGVESDLRNAAALAETWKVDNPNKAITKDAFTNVKSTPNVTVRVAYAKDDGTFKLCGFHSNGNTTEAKAWVYDSAAGGFKKDSANCATSVALTSTTFPTKDATIPVTP